MLSSPVRRRLLEIIAQRPGLSVSELARGAGIFWTSAALHVEHLHKAGLVRTFRVGRLRVVVSTDFPQGESSDHSGILAEPACLRVATAIARSPEARVWELSALTGMSDRAIYHHLKRLVEAGLISTRKRGGYHGLEATPLLHAYLTALSSGDTRGS